jgi:spermidine/putrescine-binding protein
MTLSHAHLTPSGRSSARILGGLTAASLVAVTLTGCGLSGEAESSEATLTVATWKGYGADLPWVAEEFEKETGATIRFQYIDSLDNMLELVEEADGAIDVALPNLQYLQAGIDRDLFAPLDIEQLTNYDDIYPELADRAELRRDGALYAIPWAWGSTGLFYDSTKVAEPPTSWSVLWDDVYAGRMGLADDPTILAPIAALHVGQDPDTVEGDAVAAPLRELAGKAQLTYTSNDDLAKALSSGSAVVGVGYSSNIGSMIASGMSNLRYTIPQEGGIGWVDSWAISAKSDQRELAYEWLNFMTGPEYLTRWASDAEAFSPAPANAAALAELDAATLERLQADPAGLADLHLQLPQPEARLQSWIQAWQEAKAG